MNFLIIFVIAIIIIQLRLYFRTGNLISRLKRVLSGELTPIIDEDEDLTFIHYEDGDFDEVGRNIRSSINRYLSKNKGAVSDFNLIKDIVERNCDTLEAEISSQTPLPLYLGLMGTVAGIILGLFTITVNGGFSQIDKVIEILMTDVAIAMVASFMGILLTTLSLWKSKQCKVTVESNKNAFYTWIQTNLLPVISRSATSAITLLQQNLTRFNSTFTGTVDRLEERLGDVGDLYASQIEILEKIEAIDVKKMAVANVKILSALDGSVGSLDRFSQYMTSVTDYLTAVRDLNSKLDEHLERTETLGVVSDFYRSQMNEISLRQDAIRSAVLGVDDVMRSALASLRESSESGVKMMQEMFVSQMSTMQQMVTEQTAQLTSQINQMPQLMQRFDEIAAIPAKLDSLLEGIEKANTNMVKELAKELKRMPVQSTVAEPPFTPADDTARPDKPTKWMRMTAFGSIVIIGIYCLVELIDYVYYEIL